MDSFLNSYVILCLMFSSSNKRGVVVIVGTLLLLIAAIFFLLYFSQWNLHNNTSMLSEVEKTSSDINLVKISNGFLYVMNYNDRDVDYNNIYVDSIMCNYSGTLVPGVNTINISGCLPGDGVFNVKLVADNLVSSSLLKIR